MRRLFGLLALLSALACSYDQDLTSTSFVEKLKSIASFSTTPEGPFVRTNKDDYIPGEMVVMVGSGFEPGEFISLTLTETPELHHDRVFMITADSVGSFWFDEFSPEEHHVGVSFVLTALGETSGRQAQTAFTDAIVLGNSTPNHNGDPGASQLALQRPSGVVAGTFLIAQVAVQGLNTIDVICTPTGWTLIRRENNGSNVSQALFYRVADGTEPVSWNWLIRSSGSSCSGSAISGLGAVGGIIAYSGVDVTPTTDAILASAPATGGDVTINAPNIVGPFPTGSRVVRFFANDKDNVEIQATGRIYAAKRPKSGGSPSEFLKPAGAAADAVITAVPSGPTGTLTGSNSPSTSASWIAHTVVLREAAVVPPTLSIGDVTAKEQTAMATTAFSFTVTLSAASAQTVTATWATANGTTNPATGGLDCSPVNDYITNGGTVTFTPGVTLQQVTVEVCADGKDEVDETFFVNLSNPSASATISDNQGLGTIQDDDDPPTVSIGDVTLAEGNAGTTGFGFTVSLSAVSGKDVTVSYSTANGTTNPATGGGACPAADYQSVANGSLTIPAGQASGTVTINVCGDLVNEANETFFVNLATPTNATINDGQGVGTITNDDAAPTISINDVTANEGNAGTTNFGFTVSLTAASGQTVTVNYATANGTTNPATGGAACAGVDYETDNGTVTFNPGVTAQNVTVVVCGDVIDEPNETFFVNLATPSNATINDGEGLGTITDDDDAPTVSINNVTQAEGDAGSTNFVFQVTLSGASGQSVTVNFATANGTTNPATGGAACGAGVDYVSQNGTVTFPAGDVSQDVTIAVCGDLVDELDETFVVNLSGGSNGGITDNQGLGTITDNDGPPTLSINDLTLAEGNAGTTSFIFTVSPSALSGQDITVNYSTTNGSTNPATGGASCASADYQSVANGSLTIPAGQPSGTLTINVCGDLVNEANETFFVNLATPTNATINDGQGVGTITNDDAAPTLAINDVSVTEGNGGTTTAQFTVTLTGATSQTVTVDYATANGTTNPATGNGSCAAGVDYISANGTLSFTPGQTSKTIDVSVCGDLPDEANETFFVNLTNEAIATVTDAQGLGTINDDDNPPTLSINDVTVAEGNAGTTDASFIVSLSVASGQAVAVDFGTANGTTNPATGGAACGAGVDYETQSGSVSFTAGQTSKTITVKVCGDLVNEANETYVVDLSNPSNASVSDDQGLGTITNDDTPADNQGPITSNVLVAPIPTGQPGTVTANVNDAPTGNSKVASAEFSIDGGTWTAMSAQDGDFDVVSENVTGTIPASGVTGVFQVCVRGYDEHGNLGNTECFFYAVYDPSAGFVTGGGWINSPEHAYPADPTLTGRANFGFVSKYRKGATTPEGSTEFQFQVANLNFHSTSYQWLVVTAGSAPRAQFKGTGRLNGVDGYNFLITAVDGGKNTYDAFRIKITQGNTVIYDNQPGTDENTAAATQLAGGSIVIHSK